MYVLCLCHNSVIYQILQLSLFSYPYVFEGYMGWGVKSFEMIMAQS